MIRRTLLFLLTFCVVVAPAALAQGNQQSDGDVPSFLRDGNFYLLQGDCELAQYFFQEALKLEAANVEAMVGKGKALACRSNFALAIEEFQKAIEASPQDTSAYVQLALAYQDQYLSDPNRFPNRLNDALSTLETAERFAPDNAQVLNTKGVVLYQMGNLQDARTALERSASLASQPASNLGASEQSVIQVNLGKTYRDLGELELARTAFRRAVTLDPASASAHNNLGNIHYRLGDCESAQYELSQAASLNPQSLSAVSQLAIALFECGNVEGSIPRFEQALELDGAVFTPPLYTYLARGYLQQGRFDDAVRRAQQGALLPPESADAYYWLGQVYEGRGAGGDGDKARSAYQKALQINPDYSAAQEALAKLP